MRTVRMALVGVVAQAAVLSVVAGAVGLDARGWAVGLLAGVGTNASLALALRAAGATRLGPANLVTLSRATLAGAVAALAVDAVRHPLHVTAVLALTVVALSLDAVDGWVARRTGSVSAVGARFDGEVDAFLILALSIAVSRVAGPWVLAIGMWRYAFGAAGWPLPWLRAPLPFSYWRKTVAAIQGVSLAVAVSGLLPHAAMVGLLVAALTLLSESFCHDIWWLWTRRVRVTGSGGRRRRLVRQAGTVAAAVVTWGALVLPDRARDLTPTTFLRVPIEALVLVAVAMLLPGRGRRFLGLAAGLGLAVLTLLRILDIGFFAVLDRPFSPVTDWSSIGPAIGVLSDSIGHTRALLLATAAVVLLVVMAVAVTWAVVQVSRVAARRRHVAAQTTIGLGVAWTLCALLGVTTTSGAPVAASSTAHAAAQEVRLVQSGLRDEHTFNTRLAAVDRYALAPPSQLLTGLRGKDVLLVFVESYGQVAVQGTSFSPQVDAILRAGTTSLRAAGFSARSAFLTSPTFGGGSWYAHSTLQSGLWIDNPARYSQLLASHRFTLTTAFGKAGWRTLFDLPTTKSPWIPGQEFYGFDAMLGSTDVGYAGPAFSFAKIPDQYTLQVLDRRELQPADRPPLFAEVVLDSSHAPWTPLPRMVPWQDLGDGAIFRPMVRGAASPEAVVSSTPLAQAAYGQSVDYTLTALISFLQRSDDKNLVVIALGDHQPFTVVSGDTATHNVPVTIIARDQRVIDRISSWGWQDGLLPHPDAPVWRMDAFRDRFLDTFGGPRAAPTLTSGSKP